MNIQELHLVLTICIELICAAINQALSCIHPSYISDKHVLPNQYKIPRKNQVKTLI